jgi:predicted ribosome quality control (RQC) complex YloA/Tae2 family protein
MTGRGGEDPSSASDPESGARSFLAEGYEILVGKGARDNERLTFREARPTDLWLHAAGFPGSHVLVRANDGETGEVPPAVQQRAAALAVWFSKARQAGGKVPVHVCRARDVSRRPGAPAGQVQIRNYQTLRVYSRDPGSHA